MRQMQKSIRAGVLIMLAFASQMLANAFASATGSWSVKTFCCLGLGGEELPFSGEARLPVLLFEPERAVTVRFSPDLREWLQTGETLVIIAANCKILERSSQYIVIVPAYEDGANHGCLWFYARKSDSEERLLGTLHFASTKMGVDSEDDLVIDPMSIRDLPVMVDESNRPIASVGFPVEGHLGWILFEHGDSEGAAPDRERPGMPKWAEAVIRVPPGTKTSLIPPSAMPRRPRDCDGFVNGRKQVEGEWIVVNRRRTGNLVRCGSIDSQVGSTRTYRLCGRAAVEFAANFGIRLPMPGGRVDLGDIKIVGEIGGCITITVVNNTNTRVDIFCQAYEFDLIKIRDIFCCVNGQVRLCERWVCWVTVTRLEQTIPGIGGGITIPPNIGPVGDAFPCQRTH